VSTQNHETVLTAGDPTVLVPPFPLLPFPVVLSYYLPVSEPHANFTAPHTYGGSSCIRSSPEPAPALPASALTWNFAKVLSRTCLTRYFDCCPASDEALNLHQPHLHVP
jgi:hypothetical protein